MKPNRLIIAGLILLLATACTIGSTGQIGGVQIGWQVFVATDTPVPPPSQTPSPTSTQFPQFVINNWGCIGEINQAQVGGNNSADQNVGCNYGQTAVPSATLAPTTTPTVTTSPTPQGPTATPAAGVSKPRVTPLPRWTATPICTPTPACNCPDPARGG